MEWWIDGKNDFDVKIIKESNATKAFKSEVMSTSHTLNVADLWDKGSTYIFLIVVPVSVNTEKVTCGKLLRYLNPLVMVAGQKDIHSETHTASCCDIQILQSRSQDRKIYMAKRERLPKSRQ